MLGLNKQNAINFQLLGGVWILQTILAIVAGLYTRWFHRWALLVGWAVAMVYGTIEAYRQTIPNTVTKLVDGQPVATTDGVRHFGSSLADFPFTQTKVYVAATALIINIVVAVVLTLVLRAVRAPAGTDATSPADYYSDAPSDDVLHVTKDELAAESATWPALCLFLLARLVPARFARLVQPRIARLVPARVRAIGVG